jgi:hypothetical protein
MKVRCFYCKKRFSVPEGRKYPFCSWECACYSGYYNITKGWIKDPEEAWKACTKQKKTEQ